MSHPTGLALRTDVLVVGGGMAGAWAALSAARTGAQVLLVDKGYFGTSGVTATAGPGHWWVPPGQRDEAVRQRHARTLGLADPAWMHRIADTTWQELPGLAPWYRFTTTPDGRTHHGPVRGPEYLRALRQRVLAAGVTVWDHSPALELLRAADGSVAGARGLQRQPKPGRDWTVHAPAVVLASGGCAFGSWLLGSQNNTGDGHLMAAEAGVPLADMEFGNAYCIAQAGTAMTRSAFYAFATLYDAQGRELPHDTVFKPEALMAAWLAGPLQCSLHRMPADLRTIYPQISPNVPLGFDRQGIDPYTQRFDVTFHAEGTIRGTGGLELADDQCQTCVPGLYAAGDAASRGRVAGATTGGGAVNAAWALSSGVWSGQAAAQRALALRGAPLQGAQALGEAGLRPLLGQRPGHADPAASAAALRLAVQREMLPPQKNWRRSGPALLASAARLDDAWGTLRERLAGPPGDLRGRLRARESAALVAMSRWALRAALARTESRGLHSRSDHPQALPGWTHRLGVSGLDRVQVAAIDAAAGTPAPGAASDAEGPGQAPAQAPGQMTAQVQAQMPA